MSLDVSNIIKGVKSVKKENRPDDRGFPFDKTKPINAYNFPISKVTEWYAFGYRLVNGRKVYDWITKRLPTGHAFIPDLDKCLKIESKQIY